MDGQEIDLEQNQGDLEEIILERLRTMLRLMATLTIPHNGNLPVMAHEDLVSLRTQLHHVIIDLFDNVEEIEFNNGDIEHDLEHIGP